MLSLSNKKLFLLFSKNNLYKYDIIIIQDTLPPWLISYQCTAYISTCYRPRPAGQSSLKLKR